MSPTVAISHDHLTQRGGAERVVLTMQEIFDGAPVYTALYDPQGTYPEFRDREVRPHTISRVATLRRNHRWSLPVTAPAFSSMRSTADVTICSTSGWAHGIRCSGRKLVYCHSPARWLYRPDDYLRHFGRATRFGLAATSRALRRWDRAAMASADRIVVNSTTIAEEVWRVYRREAEVIPPTSALSLGSESAPIGGLAPGFVLCVSRMLGYKHLDVLLDVAAELSVLDFVIVGGGPLLGTLRRQAPPNVRLLGSIADPELRWCYQQAACLVSTSEEDFGLTPLEAGFFGRPSVVPRARGYLDHVAEGRTGLFHDGTRADLSAMLQKAMVQSWNSVDIRSHAARFGVDVFAARLRALVEGLG